MVDIESNHGRKGLACPGGFSQGAKGGNASSAEHNPIGVSGHYGRICQVAVDNPTYVRAHR